MKGQLLKPNNWTFDFIKILTKRKKMNLCWNDKGAIIIMWCWFWIHEFLGVNNTQFWLMYSISEYWTSWYIIIENENDFMGNLYDHGFF